MDHSLSLDIIKNHGVDNIRALLLLLFPGFICLGDIDPEADLLAGGPTCIAATHNFCP